MDILKNPLLISSLALLIVGSLWLFMVGDTTFAMIMGGPGIIGLGTSFLNRKEPVKPNRKHQLAAFAILLLAGTQALRIVPFVGVILFVVAFFYGTANMPKKSKQ